MCQRCSKQFTIHSIKELNNYLYAGSYHKKAERLEVVKIWWQRGYLTNLQYLEYQYDNKRKR